jgi:hypothetical protein
MYNFDEKEFNSEIKLKPSKTERANSVNPNKKTRPQTPHIDFLAIRESKKTEPENIIKNFSSFMKQIVDTQNKNFLNGDLNVIEYLISKYTGIEVENVKSIEKLSIKINSDFGLLNQFGQYLPNLRELKLNSSLIQVISDIGTNFSNLKILHVNNCNLKDLSGI